MYLGCIRVVNSILTLCCQLRPDKFIFCMPAVFKSETVILKNSENFKINSSIGKHSFTLFRKFSTYFFDSLVKEQITRSVVD